MATRSARKVIDNLIATKQLSQDGLNWLIQATDPFHDASTPTVGYPDISGSQSVVQTFSQTSIVTTPLGSSPALWDAHLFFNPMTYNWFNGSPTVPAGLFRSTITGKGIWTAATNGSIIYGGYNALTLGTGLDWQNASSIGGSSVNPTIAIPATACSGLTRLVAAGMEVVNVTPTLYRGGSCTVFRSPSTETSNLVIGGALVTMDGCAVPPSTQSQAQTYPTSKTWGAEEGCYVVAPMSNENNPFLNITPNEVMALQPFPSGLGTNNAMFAWTNPAGVLGAGPPQACQYLLPFDTHGAIFTGLQPQAVLQVTTRYYFERIPTITQPDLLVLVRPPADYDSMALELYCKAIQALPVGVMVKENPLGEWWNDVLETVAEYAPAVGGIFGPVGSTIGNVIGTGAKSVLNSRTGGKKGEAAPSGYITKAAVNQSQRGNSHRTQNQGPRHKKPKKNRKKKKGYSNPDLNNNKDY